MSENQRDPQYKLRWSEDLRDKVSQSAKEHNRSMNAEICLRLEQSFETTQSQESEIDELRKEIKNMNMTIHTLAEALVNKGE
jgi:DNA anti-recombination protein RmuC